ncbi:hypothetical protein GJ688_06040 [Heliobacillus mobilis]|uniref:Uncharacterized protein n=1 Tax=Heliobacterium mobile TaxID=28064 RepID=A0A6I3SIF5_HELMO|nr:hypothetical protein [Heliobacterium mobile]MTV48542.1 hypothetical protein [Heliobacterium mobile]
MGKKTSSSASSELTGLRFMQALGQLLVATGASLAFYSLVRQIPLLEQQGDIIKKLSRLVKYIAASSPSA